MKRAKDWVKGNKLLSASIGIIGLLVVGVIGSYIANVITSPVNDIFRALIGLALRSVSVSLFIPLILSIGVTAIATIIAVLCPLFGLVLIAKQRRLTRTNIECARLAAELQTSTDVQKASADAIADKERIQSEYDKLKSQMLAMNAVERLDAAQTARLRESIEPLLEEITTAVVRLLKVSPSQVRACVFICDSCEWLAMKFASSTMPYTERAVRIPVGYGVSGRAFQTCAPGLGIYKEETGWGPKALAGNVGRLVHEKLQWVVAVPVPVGDPLFVLSVDGVEVSQSRETLMTTVFQEVSNYLLKADPVLKDIYAREGRLNGT